jgi:hypothetical protein
MPNLISGPKEWASHTVYYVGVNNLISRADSMDERLRDIPLFHNFSDDQLRWLEQHSQALHLGAGDYT